MAVHHGYGAILFGASSIELLGVDDVTHSAEFEGQYSKVYIILVAAAQAWALKLVSLSELIAHTDVEFRR